MTVFTKTLTRVHRPFSYLVLLSLFACTKRVAKMLTEPDYPGPFGFEAEWARIDESTPRDPTKPLSDCVSELSEMYPTAPNELMVGLLIEGCMRERGWRLSVYEVIVTM